jgi:hypothetical protein
MVVGAELNRPAEQTNFTRLLRDLMKINHHSTGGEG